MKATLLPLRGKYYGTLIEIEDGFKHTISLWHSGSFEPSDRELEGICSIEQWRNNEKINVTLIKIIPKNREVLVPDKTSEIKGKVIKNNPFFNSIFLE